MEIILALVVVGILAWLGVFRPLETAAVAIDEEVAVLAAERKVENIDRINALQIDEKSAQSAKEKIKHLNSIRL